MLTILLPTEKAWFMLPLIRTSAKNKTLFLPNTSTGKIKSCICKCLSEVKSFCIRMEHIDTCIIGHSLIHTSVGIKKELIELIICHVVVFDFPCTSFIVHVVRRVCYNKVRFLIFHQYLIGFFPGAVPTDKSVVSKYPHITRFCHRCLFKFCIYIEIIFFHIII